MTPEHTRDSTLSYTGSQVHGATGAKSGGGCWGSLVSMADGSVVATQHGSYDDEGNLIFWQKPITFTVEIATGESARRAVEMLEASIRANGEVEEGDWVTRPASIFLIADDQDTPDIDDNGLQEGDARWLRHTVDLDRGRIKRVDAPGRRALPTKAMFVIACIVTSCTTIAWAAYECWSRWPGVGR